MGAETVLPTAEQERARILSSIAMENRGNTRIDRNSSTWIAAKDFIRKQMSEDYMPTLRRKGIDHGQTEYARGAMDALDSLLQFGGEEV